MSDILHITKPIRFLSKNYITENCKIDVTGEVEFNASTLFDFEPFKQNNILVNGTRTVKFTVWLRDNFLDFVGEDIDTFILQNHNWKNFTVSYIDNNEETHQLISYVDNLQSDLIIGLPQVYNIQRLVFEVTDVIGLQSNSVNIGQLRACKNLFDLFAKTSIQVDPVTSEGSFRTFDGTLVSWKNFEKWGARITAENIKKSQFDMLKSFIKKDGYITVIPFYDWEAKDIYECLIKRDNIGSYAVDRYSALISTTFNLEAKEDATN